MKKYLILSIMLSLLLGVVALANAEDVTAPVTPNLPCMKTAVEKREAAIQTAFDAFSASTKTALETRKSELSAAWSLTDKTARKEAIKNAWTKFKQSEKSARSTFKQARKAAWDQFVVDRKACKVSASYESRGNDINL